MVSQESYGNLGNAYGDNVTTKRGLRNKYHMLRGWGVVKELVGKEVGPGLDYLIDPNKERIYSEGILRELGLINDKDLIKKVAMAICEAQAQLNWPRYRYQALLKFCRLSGMREYLLAIIKETVSENVH